MATPMNADTMVKILRAEGLKVVEVREWRTHNRNHKGAWGPVHGVMLHHTAKTSDPVSLCYNGRSDLPGPLSHGVITKDGTVHLIGNGRANHAGAGDADVLAAVREGREAPVDNETDADGNIYFYGFECHNNGDGIDPWPTVQVQAMIKVSAAISRHHGWNKNHTIGHKEWRPGKIDPRGIPFEGMDNFRDWVGAKIAIKPTVTPKPTPVYAPFPGKTFFRLGKSHPVIYEMSKALVRAGYNGYQQREGNVFTRSDIKAYAWWQRKLGYSGSDADGYPGKTSWDKLKVSQPPK